MTFSSPGSLPAGTYYLSMSYDLPDVATQASTDGRWHGRSQNASSGFAFSGEVDISWADCPVAGGGTADFNCDGDAGTDSDIEAFFRCLAGNCPAAPCANTADYNNDGDVGTDADIDSFFRVLSGGPC